MLVRSCLLMMQIRFSISLLIFCLVIHQMLKRGLKSQTVTVEIAISPFSYNSFCFTYFAVLLSGTYNSVFTLLSLYNAPSLSLSIFCAVMSTASDGNISTLIFLRLVFA